MDLKVLDVVVVEEVEVVAEEGLEEEEVAVVVEEVCS